MIAPVDVKKDLTELYTAIMDRVKGRQVNSVGHGGRNVGYDGTSLEDMIATYRMLWLPTYGLPQLPLDLKASAAERGCFRIRMR